MGKIIAVGHISLDGYMADRNRQIDWIRMDGETHKMVAELIRVAEGTIYGRKTYELMDPFWPNVMKEPEKWPGWVVEYAEWVDKAVKVVVSTTLDSISWQNTRLIKENVVEEIRRVREEVKGDLLLLASGQLLATLLPAGLVDEVVVTITPVILVDGLPYFAGLKDRVGLELKEERKFANGVVGLWYDVVGK
ncbi:MAG TPA: dihydrofolate reductase family protein [Puia sp.]|jgi:dihydrofolate reductase|nr:dihydrofolate reductase family protein [Puia sp.]